MKKKLIITGASGFLGYHLARLAVHEWEVYAFYRNRATHFLGVQSVKCELCNYVETGNLLEDIEPDAVIHLAAVSDTQFCQQNPEASYLINVEATRNLAGLCSDFQIPFVFASTDLVFDGQKGNYNEEDTPNPLNIYAEQKVIAEQEVQKIYPQSLVARLPLMFGLPNASDGNYLHQFIKRLSNHEIATLFTDEYRSVCGARSVSFGLLQLMNQSGIIHIAGRERLSRYNFGMMAAEKLKLDASLIKAGLQKDVKMAAPRPADVSLNISKALALGYSPMGIADELALIASSNYLP